MKSAPVLKTGQMTRSTIHKATPPRIAIAGAGAAGLACAWALAREGAQVTLVDAAEAGGGALWASGGMLAGGFESCAELDPDHPLAADFAAIAARAGAVWSRWGPRLEAESGIGLSYERAGALTPAFSADEAGRVETVLARAEALSVPVRRLTGEEVAGLEPSLAPARAGVLFEADGQIDNRALGRAFRAALLKRGCAFITGVAVRSIETSGGRACGVALADGRRISADIVIIAAGAANLEGAPRMRPVKGQMLAFAAARPPAPQRIIRSFSIYLAAKPGGRLVAGATSEPDARDLRTDDESIEGLAARACSVIPGLRGARVTERWAGLRPASADAMPVIGETAPGVFTAAGAYRNGVLLAPVMAEGLAALIIRGRSLPEAAPFHPGRAGLEERR